MMMQQRQSDFAIGFVVPRAPVQVAAPARPGPWGRAAQAVSAWLARAARRAEERRALAQLLRMEGYLLRDIGVTRDSLERLVRGEAD